MRPDRREFIQGLLAAALAGFDLNALAEGRGTDAAYDLPAFGNVSLLHFTDCHAQLLPTHFREPSINIGIGDARGRAPHLVGKHFLEQFQVPPGSAQSHAFTYLDFVAGAETFGATGGFAHLATLIRSLRSSRPHSLLLDGGDTWQGSATALWTRGRDMVGACKLLGVDVMTGHWEFTYGKEHMLELIQQELEGSIEFLAHNVYDISFGEDPVFAPYTVRTIGGVRVAIIGQAFPYTPIAHPRRFVEDWSFGIREAEIQGLVDTIRSRGVDAVVLLSHNGMDVDLKLASRVTGIDAILGGHTHDGMPAPVLVDNRSGQTMVINSGSNGKFLSVLDLDVRGGAVRDYRFNMLPVFSNLLEPDAEMSAYIRAVREPFAERLREPLAVTETLLYRRGNFTGSFDQVICDALIRELDAEIALSPGFRWGTTVLPGEPITVEALLSQTAITYANTRVNEMSGARLKAVLEDISDNLFNPDPYLQMGGDMARVGGLHYGIDPNEPIGRRIFNLTLNGRPIRDDGSYRVARWAAVNEGESGPPVWEVVADYLRDIGVVSELEVNLPGIRGVSGNPGLGGTAAG